MRVVFDENIEQFAGHDEIVERIEKLTLLDESDVRDVPPIPIVQMDENLEDNIPENVPDTQPATNTQAATDVSSASTELNQTVDDPNDTRTYKRWTADHPQELIIGSVDSGDKTRRQMESLLSCYVCQTEPTTITEALNHADWVVAMQEEPNQFDRNGVWELVERPPKGTKVIGHKMGF